MSKSWSLPRRSCLRFNVALLQLRVSQAKRAAAHCAGPPRLPADRVCDTKSGFFFFFQDRPVLSPGARATNKGKRSDDGCAPVDGADERFSRRYARGTAASFNPEY